jgi:prepilin-type N-terminal cleavage/methylation domain-containing protein
MHIARYLRRSERGDTLVEVLIAIAVISLILGGAFVMTNRSLQGTRDAQERVNATKLVEGQVERIKNIASSTNSDTIFGTSVPASYCIDDSLAVWISTNARCAVDVSGAPTTAEPKFQLTVTRTSTATTETFTVRAVWTSVRGDTQNNVEMKYRAYAQ